MGQLIAAAGRTGLQLAQQLFRNGAQTVFSQRAEHDDLIQPPDELRAEPLFCLCHGLLRLLFKGCLTPRRKTQRRALPGQKACTKVGSQQHDGIPEIRLAAHGVGQLAIFQQLQQDILDIRVCLFDLVKQHDAVGASADGLGQLSAFVVAQIARRRAQQAGHGVLLLIL